MFVFVDDAAEAVASADGEVRDLVWIGDRFGQWLQWSGVRDAPVGPMFVVVPLVLAQRVQEVALVPDQCAVEQFAAAGLDPPFHDRVHAGHPDAAEHDLDPGVGEDRVEHRRVLAVAVADQEPCPAAGVLQVHGEVADGLGDPGRGRVGGGAQDP